MNTLKYNTNRAKLRMPEYGREVQEMVDHCMLTDDREERQKCANTIIRVMKTMHPELKHMPDYEERLWHHLAAISNYQLDIDYPYPIDREALENSTRQPLKYSQHRIPIRHYGHLIMETINVIKTMEEGDERNELIRQVANQMKRELILYGHGNPDNERVANDLALLSDGNIQIDINTFKFEYIKIDTSNQNTNANRKKKK